ncbi:MAG: hypothetical protein ABJF10_04215 [Chthoniobacter sp.]|uniref:hypothetical protein n=1 Tax=Chthoniobacter sp. TaxID=2510640 RepID=UPI0032AB2EF2
MNETFDNLIAGCRNRLTGLRLFSSRHARWVKCAKSAGAVLLLGSFALGLGGCAGYYEPGYAGGYYDPNYAPFYSDYGYNDSTFGGFGAYSGDVFVGGIHHRGYYGGHHFSHDFRGGGGHGGGGHHR